MMEDFIIHNPATGLDPASKTIEQLRSWNTLLTIGIIISLSAAVYIAYQYYQLGEDD